MIFASLLLAIPSSLPAGHAVQQSQHKEPAHPAHPANGKPTAVLMVVGNQKQVAEKPLTWKEAFAGLFGFVSLGALLGFGMKIGEKGATAAGNGVKETLRAARRLGRQ
eukprot:NODE_890_length_3281_cov_0.434318.p6 type:complete len:108 gc:universal NODE_890_length_3281_cov_0.434318:1377-1700(+)